MSSLTRGQRRLLQYATHNGELKELKRRRVEDVVPVLQQRRQKQRHSNGTDTAESTDASSAASVPLSAEVLGFLREHCPKIPRKLRQSQLRVVGYLSSAVDQRTGGEQIGSFAVKRIEISDRANAFAVVALAALQRRALWKNPTSHGASLLVLVDDATDAAALASHMRKKYKLTHTLVLDGSRFPTFPAIEEDAEATSTLANRTAVVITSCEAFLAVDVRSAIWKFIGAYAVMLKSSSGVVALTKNMTQEERMEFHEKLCRQRWRCLGHVSLAAVIAPSRQTLFAPTAEALTTSPPTAGGEQSSTVKGDGNGGSTKTEEDKRTVTATADAIRQPVTVHYAVVEGTHRFQTLYTLLMGLRAGQGLVVHFATKEALQFMDNILYALGELPASLLLLTDYEGPSTYASVQDNEDREKLCAKFDEIVMGGAQKDSSSKQEKDRVVLLSSFGLVPQRGTIFVQYDVMVDIVNFSQFVSDVLTPAAYNETALEPAIRRRLRTPSPPPAQVGKRKGSKGGSPNAPPAEASLPAKTMYQSVLVFFRRNEVHAALSHLRRPAKRLNVSFEPLPRLPSATRFFLEAQKVRSLNKKQFSIQNAAYAAYRATMLLYSLIGPSNVYNERCVDLAKVAEEFGYTEVPLVDLRTRDTPFRRKEDIFRAARERAVFERRKLRAYVNQHIVGEGPEEHIADI